jgi:hypothetical protein
LQIENQKEKAPALSGASGEKSRGSKHGEGYEDCKSKIKEQSSKIKIMESRQARITSSILHFTL